MNVQLIVDYFGSQCEMARLLSTSQQNISNWVRTNKVPAHWVLRIEKLSKGKFKRNAIRPDVFGK